MNARRSIEIVGIALVSACLGSMPARAEPPLEQDLEQIMAWWPGVYNNDRQVAEVEARMGEENFTGEVWRLDGSGMGGYLNVTSHYMRLDAPAIGDNVLYVEEYRDGQPAETYRQRVYTLSVDEEEQVIRVNLANFKDREKYIGAYRDLSMLDGITPDDLAPFPAICDLIVEQRGNRYHMRMHTNACAFGGQAFSYEAAINGDAFWFRDKIVRLEDDTVVMTMANFNFHKSDRVK
ncbi:MAG: CpcT/CpeT family chromophore lyase [Gammaproteobacteria bacterium]|nr:CpcT/CpeT family chromophore lyase [Gammaproteobacteria bacterium]